MRRIQAVLARVRRYYGRQSIRIMISLAFTIAAIAATVLMAVVMYAQFASSLRATILRENQQLVGQVALNVESYTRSMRLISDSMYYKVIKNMDLADEENLRTLRREMSLMYEANKDNLISVACYTAEGKLVAAMPLENPKPHVDVREQDWFVRANETIENNHFSTPHVQNLFDDSTARYRWVVSLSRMVELSSSGGTSGGVLLVDMNYSGIERIFPEAAMQDGGYIYLIDKNGEIIYHPKQKLIYSGLFRENNLQAATYTDGLHEERFDGVTRQVIVKDTGYTGWRIVSVIPNSAFQVTNAQMQVLVAAIAGLAIVLIVIVNYFVSALVTNPIRKLDDSVRVLDEGKLEDLRVFEGGPNEVAHLGRTIRRAVDQMRRLMDDVVREQEEKRKSEFDTLQAQINPHFLYNTLDSIVWMIESGNDREAISMVTALASLFRISLSGGHTVIPIQTELQHAGYYLYIQNIRYKNKFTVNTEVDAGIEEQNTIKLVLQPLLENAIYHAMEMMDGDGVITIRGYAREDGVYLEVADNGLGMTREKMDSLLQPPPDDAPVPGRRGSGIGLRNVHQRIQLYYGPQYGLEVESELDVGTTVRVHLPPGKSTGGGVGTGAGEGGAG